MDKRGGGFPTLVKVTVGFNQQQMQFLEELRREKRFGETYSEVIRSIFAQ